MTRFYCPRCWKDFVEDCAVCPFCGLKIQEFWDSMDHVEKLILALHHPEPSTPVRAAWLLGKTGDSRAVRALIDVFNQTDDVYLSRAVVSALGESDTPEALRFLETLSVHPASLIRHEVERVLATKKMQVSNHSKSKEQAA